MRTLRDFFHMGRVLWVTFQEPWSQERVGGGIVEEGVVEVEVVGWRREMGGGEVVVAMVGGLVVVVERVRCSGLGRWCCGRRERGLGGASSWVDYRRSSVAMCVCVAVL